MTAEPNEPTIADLQQRIIDGHQPVLELGRRWSNIDTRLAQHPTGWFRLVGMQRMSNRTTRLILLGAEFTRSGDRHHDYPLHVPVRGSDQTRLGDSTLISMTGAIRTNGNRDTRQVLAEELAQTTRLYDWAQQAALQCFVTNQFHTAQAVAARQVLAGPRLAPDAPTAPDPEPTHTAEPDPAGP